MYNNISINKEMALSIIDGFDELKSDWEYRLQDTEGFLDNLRVCLSEDEKEADSNNKYSNDTIGHIIDTIEKQKEIVELCKNKLSTCNTVIETLKQLLKNNDEGRGM